MLAEIRSTLEPYHTAYCGLKHEQVTEVSAFENTPLIKRYGFCDSSARKYRLGCAHTTANQEFCRAILSIRGQFPGAQALAEKFEQLFLNIYILDIAKGVLDKQLAFATLANNDLLIVEAKAAIAETIAAHHQLIRSIEKQRLQLMADLSPL
ncbi:hypothetical protein KXQ82_03580 [Mucilaginibacter sp. HMF5004]|uniref:hypothetical protein n=1 Tax=Mucilaginibacter rivuli TaxID=2857527 RepID=UPI001C5F178C|nr:hypothetical protein [Mucilaginibacter rivuli]MBW4888775.1 hypothetical protein [Mucilaginibacter rivuli]